jgi:KDO2-lipid IV(A) lauroyltransferase
MLNYFLTTLVSRLLWLIAQLPLAWIQYLGAQLAYAIYKMHPHFRDTIITNLRKTPFYSNEADLHTLAQKTAYELGKSLFELSIAWCAPPTRISEMIISCHGWPQVQAALDEGQGLLFVTPHLGNYDIGGRYISSRLPFSTTAMFRPPKLSFLEPIMQAGRIRSKGKTAPASIAGVKLVMQALKKGEASIILPDQVPQDGGDGLWVPFFKKPAYTMTLVPRLAKIKNVATFYFFTERLPHGQGFIVHIEKSPPFSGDPLTDTKMLNLAVESLIAKAPEQYLWSYRRYKHPAGAPLPPSSENLS